MRCDCCNKNLNDFEATLKHAITGEPLDTCRACLKGLGIPTLGRADLKADESPPADWLDVGDPLFDKIEGSYYEDD